MIGQVVSTANNSQMTVQQTMVTKRQPPLTFGKTTNSLTHPVSLYYTQN